ncbi:MAG TPA: hypothetical protein VEJ67_00405 [Candidatus Cybelea sp.]|nr:hypothetical protein [Candidatus Cybelea sp.]
MKRGVAITGSFALLLSAALGLGFRPSLYAPYEEGQAYVHIAHNDYSQVYSYYGGRVLHPLFARFIAAILHRPIDARIFLCLSAASLVAFFLALGIHYGIAYSSSGVLWIALLATATVVDAYRNYYWHDLFYAALCAVFFVALRSNLWLAVGLLVPLYWTRESTIVLVGAVVLIAALERRWAVCAAAALVGLLAMRIDSALVARALPNHQGLSLAALDVLKVPYNFAFNVCGLEFWANTNSATLDPPIWVARVPVWLHLGNIREVGYSGFSWQRPVQTLLTMATAFGVLPLAAMRLPARKWTRLVHGRFDMATSLVYGALMFGLTPLVGTVPERYVLYSWPLFWWFAVDLLTALPDLRTRVEAVLLCVLAAWAPALVRLCTGPSIEEGQSVSTVGPLGLVISLALVAAIYVAAWRLLCVGNRRVEAGFEPARGSLRR